MKVRSSEHARVKEAVPETSRAHFITLLHFICSTPPLGRHPQVLERLVFVLYGALRTKRYPAAFQILRLTDYFS